jgi:alpha-tubulin suppressor-like RCC1 family protein
MSDCDKDSQLITSLPPQRVIFPNSDPIIQIACGSYHSVVLTSKDGQNNVYTFGSNQYGQLGIVQTNFRLINTPKITFI